MVVDWSLQDAVWEEIETLRGADRVPAGTNDVATELIENFYGRATAREFTFEADEPATLAGGQNRGPRPLEYFLAGLAFCQQVILAKNALATGIEFDSLAMDVHGDVDPRGVLGVGDVAPGFVDNTIRYTTRIESDAAREEVVHLLERAERHCPAHASLRTETTLERDVQLNGDPLEF